MRFIDIKFSERNAPPGGTIRGVVILETNDAFRCNRVILKVKGKEKTRMGSGDTNISDERIHAGGEMVLSEATDIPLGKTEFPFGFILDDNLPPTYSGYYGWIEYNVEAVVELDWKLDPKMTRRFRVLPYHPVYIPEREGYSPKKMMTDVLHVELPSDIMRMREGMPVQFMVEEHSRVSGVRFEVRRREKARCRSQRGSHDVTIVKKFVPISVRDFNGWNEVIIGENWRRVPFRSKLLETSYYLKVILEMRWEIDPFVTHKIKISGEKPETEGDDILDDIPLDFGFH
jgi:hypothetical protein